MPSTLLWIKCINHLSLSLDKSQIWIRKNVIALKTFVCAHYTFFGGFPAGWLALGDIMIESFLRIFLDCVFLVWSWLPGTDFAWYVRML